MDNPEYVTTGSGRPALTLPGGRRISRFRWWLARWVRIRHEGVYFTRVVPKP